MCLCNDDSLLCRGQGRYGRRFFFAHICSCNRVYPLPLCSMSKTFHHKKSCSVCKQNLRKKKQEAHPRWIDRRRHEFLEGLDDSYSEFPAWFDVTVVGMFAIGAVGWAAIGLF